jgi:hypothetical protein
MFIKKLIIKLFRIIHNFFGFNKLTSYENNGGFDYLTKFKFIKKSIHFLPYSRGLTIRGVSFLDYSKDPFGFCFKNQDFENFKKDIYIKNLEKFYKNEKNKKIKDYNSVFLNSKYEDFPIWSFSYPWENMSINEKFDHYPKLVLENRAEYVVNSNNLNFSNLYNLDYAITHANQFNNLLNIINTQGFNHNLPRPKVIILIKNNEWKWIMSGQGNHRAYLMRFLENNNLPVEIESVIYYEKLKKLKMKGNLSYTENQAKTIFDFVFDGSNVLRGII